MKHTKYLSLLLALALVLGLLSARGSTAEPSAPAAEASEPAAQSAAEAPAAQEVPEAAQEAAPVAETPAEEASAEEASAMDAEEPAEEPEPEPEDPKDLDTLESEAMDVEFPLPLTENGESLSFWACYPPFVPNFIDYAEKQTYVEAEKATGVHLDVTGVNLMEANTVFNLMIASGEYNDIISGFGMQYAGGFDDAIEQDIIIDLSTYIPELAPNYNYLLENVDEIAKAAYTDEGHIGEFSYINDSNTAIRGGLVVRGDMLTDIGMERPTTYEEMEQVLIALRDEKGIEAPFWMNSTGILAELMAGYGITNGYYQVDGQVHYGFAEVAYRDYLTMLHNWYEEGLLYHDFMSGTTAQFPEDTMVNANQCGIFYESLNQFLGYDETTSGDDDFVINGMAYPSLEKGEITHFSSRSSTISLGQGYVITTDCDNPELAVQWCNYWFTREGSLLANYGVEGVSFEYVDGKPVFTDLVMNNPDGLALDIAISLYTSFNENAYIADNTKTDASYTEAQLDAIHTWQDSSDTAYVYAATAALTSEESDIYTNPNSDMQTYVEEMTLKFIVGDTDLSEYDAYISALEGMGLESCIAVKQSALDRYNEKG